MQISTIMTRNLVTVGPDDTLATLREVFHTHEFHHLLVVDRGRLVGVVSDRDLLKNLSPFIGRQSERSQDAFLLQRKAHQVMTRQLVSVKGDTPIKVATALLLHHRVTCLPVVDDHGSLEGIVTWHDLLRYALDCGIDPVCTTRFADPIDPARFNASNASGASSQGNAAAPDSAKPSSATPSANPGATSSGPGELAA
jgi:acetoin utilization protein AcuB